MDRVPYRRVTPSRTGSSHNNRYTKSNQPENEPTKITMGETIIVQGIVSGLLLAIVLVICLIDIGPLVSIKGGLYRALEGATTVEEFSATMQRFGQNWLNTEPGTIIQEEIPQVPQLETPPLDTQAITQDEQNIPLTAYESLPNPHIPGPLVSPGLWD